MKPRHILCFLLLFIIPFLGKAQVYFLNQDEAYIRNELKTNYVVKSIENDLGKINGVNTPILRVNFGDVLVSKDGNFKTSYYMINGKCSVVYGYYLNSFLEDMVRKFDKAHKKEGKYEWVGTYLRFRLHPQDDYFIFITTIK